MSHRPATRVLMLGWEYPPRLAGGLGKACRGLSQAMAKLGAQVYFVLPTFPEVIREKSLQVVGAREVLLESGWTEEQMRAGTVEARAELATQVPGWHVIQTMAQLYPYGKPPEGPVPVRITQVMASTPITDGEVGHPLNALKSTVASGQALGRADSAGSPLTSSAQEIYGKNLWSEIERYCFAVRKLSESRAVDVVHAHDWMTFPAAFEYQKVTGVPVFLHVHSTEYDRSGDNVNSEVFRIERDGFRKATHIFAVSRYTAGVIERLYGIDRRKISVIYNAPDEVPREMRATPVDPRLPQVIFLGRLTLQKGPDHFLRAAALVAQSNPDARFVLCGVGDLLEQLRSLAFDLEIERRVHFAGFMDADGVDQVLSRSKVLVMPSVSEPFGLVALEAIQNGIPVILSKQSGVREVMSRALQVDFWDHEKLADQIAGALRLPALSRQLVADGTEDIRQLSWEKSAAKVIEAYRQYSTGGSHGY